MRRRPRRTAAMIMITLGILSYSQCQPNRDLTTGREIYKTYCTSCHGADGTLSINNAIDLSHSRLSMEGRKEIIRNGRMTMAGFSNVLSEEQIDSVARYTIELQQ